MYSFSLSLSALPIIIPSLVILFVRFDRYSWRNFAFVIGTNYVCITHVNPISLWICFASFVCVCSPPLRFVFICSVGHSFIYSFFLSFILSFILSFFLSFILSLFDFFVFYFPYFCSFFLFVCLALFCIPSLLPFSLCCCCCCCSIQWAWAMTSLWSTPRGRRTASTPQAPSSGLWCSAQDRV